MYKLLLLPLIIWCFLPGFVELYQTYSRPWLFENSLTCGSIVVLYALTTWKYGLKKNHDQIELPSITISFGFLFISLALIINNLLGGFQILPPILAYLAIYYWLGFYLKPSFWKKSLFIFILLILTLPILERLQKFVGFPIRLLTANIVSLILQLIGVSNISNSTVITTENYATTIDLPCSGVKSIYFGSIVLLATYFLQQIKISLRSTTLALFFFASLIFFNIWRVFALVYVYGVLNLIQVGDSIHIFLGIFGFIISCLLVWYGSEYIKRTEINQSKKIIEPTPIKWFNQNSTLRLCATILVITTILTTFVIKTQHQRIATVQQSIPFSIPDTTLALIPFSEKEKTLFLNTDVTFASKYLLKWKQKDISLLLVKSDSARTHHDPELCLQGLGYQLNHQEIITLQGGQINKIKVQTSRNSNSLTGTVYYWYVSKNTTITDYSQRVWEEFNHPNQGWVLVELIISDSYQTTTDNLNELFSQLTTSIRSQLF